MSEEHTKKVEKDVVRAVVESLRTTPHNSTPFRLLRGFNLIAQKKDVCLFGGAKRHHLFKTSTRPAINFKFQRCQKNK